MKKNVCFNGINKDKEVSIFIKEKDVNKVRVEQFTEFESGVHIPYNVDCYVMKTESLPDRSIKTTISFIQNGKVEVIDQNHINDNLNDRDHVFDRLAEYEILWKKIFIYTHPHWIRWTSKERRLANN